MFSESLARHMTDRNKYSVQTDQGFTVLDQPDCLLPQNNSFAHKGRTVGVAYLHFTKAFDIVTQCLHLEAQEVKAEQLSGLKINYVGGQQLKSTSCPTNGQSTPKSVLGIILFNIFINNLDDNKEHFINNSTSGSRRNNK